MYEMILAYFLAHDRQVRVHSLSADTELLTYSFHQSLLHTIKSWPKGIYDIAVVIVAVHAELDRAPSSSSMTVTTPDTAILMECLAELYVSHLSFSHPLSFIAIFYHHLSAIGFTDI